MRLERLSTLLGVFLLCWLALQSPAEARFTPISDPLVRIEPADSTMGVGEAITIAVAIEGAANLGAFEFTLLFTPSIVRVTDVALGDFLGSSGRSVVPVGPLIDNQSGEARFGAFSFGEGPGPDGAGVLATITLEAQGDGQTALDLEGVKLADIAGHPQAVTVEDGRVTVGRPPEATPKETATPEPTATVTPKPTATPMPPTPTPVPPTPVLVPTAPPTPTPTESLPLSPTPVPSTPTPTEAPLATPEPTATSTPEEVVPPIPMEEVTPEPLATPTEPAEVPPTMIPAKATPQPAPSPEETPIAILLQPSPEGPSLWLLGWPIAVGLLAVVTLGAIALRYRRGAR